MSKKRSRYKKMETLITAVLCIDAAIFLAYLIFAGFGMTGLKALTAILCFAISAAVLYFLYMTRELLRRRSIWMTLAAVCTIICILASLILRFPAPVFVLSVI
jgi:multisubunit Na+/H+ antiporter MnhB subunit